MLPKRLGGLEPQAKRFARSLHYLPRLRTVCEAELFADQLERLCQSTLGHIARGCVVRHVISRFPRSPWTEITCTTTSIPSSLRPAAGEDPNAPRRSGASLPSPFSRGLVGPFALSEFQTNGRQPESTEVKTNSYSRTESRLRAGRGGIRDIASRVTPVCVAGLAGTSCGTVRDSAHAPT